MRIPDEEQGGKREIDLVIVGGNCLLVVEQKHWSGTFTINSDEEFIQERKNGTSHNHSTVNQRIARKARMLIAMHQERIGKDDEVVVRGVLAFTNRNLDWPKYVHRVSSEVKDEAGFISLLEEESPGEINEALLETVDGFGTWDEVELNGGLMCKGDVLGLGLGDDVRSWQKERGVPLVAKVSHQSGLFSLFSSLPSSIELRHGAQHLKAILPFGAKLRMHVVGRESPEDIPWSTIASINLSKPPRHEA